MQTAQTLGEQLLSLAQHTQNPGMLLAAHRALATTLFFLGMVAAAHTHHTQGIALYEAQQHRPSAFQHGEDAGVVLLSRDANVLWVLGYPDQALGRSQAAVTLAQQRGHPFSLGYALSAAAKCHQLRREAHATQACAEAMLSLAQDHGFAYWLAYGACHRGWALAQHPGQTQEGIAQLTQGLGAYRATGGEVARSLFLALLAEAHGTMGQPEGGLTALAEALTLMDKTGERAWKPELYRLKGVLLLQQSSGHQAKAATCFQHALDMARTQQAKSFELRAATSLARLWQQQGKRQEAYDLLAPVYSWFTEGFDTADLQEAKSLLDTLA
jgi:predicted ATPase